MSTERKHRGPTFRALAFALGVVGLLLTPHASAAVVNVVLNGDFSAGLTGWTVGEYSGQGPLLIPSCASGGGDMAHFPNLPDGRTIRQSITSPASQIYKLEFDAKITGGINNVGVNRIATLSNLDPSGTGDQFVIVDFAAGNVNLQIAKSYPVPNTAPTGFVSTPAPTDGQCHHYEVYVVTVGTSRSGWLSIDGVQKLSMNGADVVGQPDVIIVGDVAGRECCEPWRGPAPDVAYDNIQFGPWV